MTKFLLTDSKTHLQAQQKAESLKTPGHYFKRNILFKTEKLQVTQWGYFSLIRMKPVMGNTHVKFLISILKNHEQKSKNPEHFPVTY